MKKCSQCGDIKDSFCFYKNKASKDGLKTKCKDCEAQQKKEYRIKNRDSIRQYFQNNKDRFKQYRKEYNLKNKEIIKNKKAAKYQLKKDEIIAKTKEYYKKNKKTIKNKMKEYRSKNIQNIKLRMRNYYELKKEKIINKNLENYKKNKTQKIKKQSIYVKEKKKISQSFKISCNLRSRINKITRGKIKSGSAIRDLGCSVEELKSYLESKFQEGMSWDNYGLYGWHIDHIIPLSSFDLTDPEQFKKACHYTNLQPLWARDNLSKGGKKNTEELFLCV